MYMFLGSILAEVKEYLFKISSDCYIFLSKPTLFKFVNLFQLLI